MNKSNRKALVAELTRRGWWVHIRDLIIITIVGVLVGIVMSGFNLGHLEETLAMSLLYSLILGGSLWKGSELISILIYTRIDLLTQAKKLVFLNSIALLMWIITDIILVNYIWYKWIISIDFSIFFTERQGWYLLYVEFSLALIINLIFFTINFFKSWNFLNKQKQELERDKMALEYQTLRDQVNPHFLFNSLNTLSALVDIDANKAQFFITELSKVYRYVLDTQKDETIPIKDELQFVDSFVHLNKLRLGDNLIVNNQLKADNSKVIPLALQMLIENAIKHNIASSTQPLHIKLTKEFNFIKVSNSYQPKANINEQKVSKDSRLGLDNLKYRYYFLTGKEVRITQKDNTFNVYLPIIE